MVNNWGTEERHGSYFPFAPQMPFEMIMLVEPSSIKVNFSVLIVVIHLAMYMMRQLGGYQGWGKALFCRSGMALQSLRLKNVFLKIHGCQSKSVFKKKKKKNALILLITVIDVRFMVTSRKTPMAS